MNREIRFRAWDKKGRFDMADVSVVDTTEKYIVVSDGFQWNIDKETQESDCVAKFDEIELMQYTGLKDKNGKEIYEGDYLKQEGLELEVKWSEFDAGFVFEDWTGSQMIMTSGVSTGYEIIGNIYENPDLLKEVRE